MVEQLKSFDLIANMSPSMLLDAVNLKLLQCNIVYILIGVENSVNGNRI